ncbi:phage portal protein [Pectobacterium carotovorum subsp. carotovorum]|uniref:phage portal protein n=1 Tax=Pectobacterium TaxID=122277 RepID=UPI0004E6BEF3|nr:phage portal protein [Pectobacterium brasiliense]KFF72101.1 phage portal protein [Pectobacterium brasiliense]GKW31372.1 phage portal protein [Pectobacterium carotovorum subsp. carotovorum]
MTKRRNKKFQATTTGNNAETFTPGRGSVITFGEPEPILTTGTDYHNIWYDNEYNHWRLPIDRLALSQLPNLNAQHGGVLYARRNMVAGGYISGGLTTDQVEQMAFDYLLFGDVAILKIRNVFGEVIDLLPLPSLYLRCRKDGSFVILQEGPALVYEPADIVFFKMYDPRQQVYGLPDYIGGIHSALLNSEATIFRRRYYNNGAHMGFILYTSDPNLTLEMENEIKTKIAESKGLGNFRNMFINIPKGNPEGVKILPVGEVSAKDEFANIKGITAQDIFTAHRFPAGLAGIIPTNGAVMGNPDTARTTYRKDEVIPLQRKFMNGVNTDNEIPAHLHLRFDVETPSITDDKAK